MTTTLLAVDDSKTMRKVLEITFAGEDEYRAVLADSAEDALTKLRANKPRLVLVDAALGGTNGYDLCQKIKVEVPGTSVILLSSKQQPFDRGRGSSAGVDDFIDKPFDTQLLIEKVGAVLSQAAQAAPAAAHRPAAAPAAMAPTAATPPAAAAAAANRPAQAPASAASASEARPRVPTVSYGATAVKPAPAVANVAPAARVGATTQTGVGAPPVASTPTAAQRQPAPMQPIAAAPAAVVAAPVKSAVAPAASPAAAKPVVAASPVVKSTVAPAPAVAPAAAVAPAPAVTAAVRQTMAAGLEGKLQGLGLTADQIKGVLALSKDVVEQVVWEVVPVLAETLIREEIERLTKD